MGRTLKRVPLNFSWSGNKVWHGYLNHFYDLSTRCACDGGYSPQYKHLENIWYGQEPFSPYINDSEPFTVETPEVRQFAERQSKQSPDYYGTREYEIVANAQRLCNIFNAQWCHHLNQEDVDVLVEGGRLWDFTRVARTPEQIEVVKREMANGNNSWLPYDNGYRPTAREVNLWSINGMGHCSSNAWTVIKARCKKNNWPDVCHICKGEAVLWKCQADKDNYDNWKPIEPPVGDGFQLWETTSEGSPQSPVFEDIDSLCAWCATNATTFGHSKATKNEWREMLDRDFVYHKEGNNIFL